MIYVRINSIKDTFGIYNYTIVSSNSLNTIMNYITKAFKPEEIDAIKVFHNPSKSVKESAHCLDK